MQHTLRRWMRTALIGITLAALSLSEPTLHAQLPHLSSGHVVTPTDWNNLVDAINTLYGGTAGQVLVAAGGSSLSSFQSMQRTITHNSTTQSIAGDGADHALTFDTNDTDPSGMHSTSSNTSRITVPIAGIYLVVGESGAGLTSANYAGLRKNGSGTIYGRVSSFGGQNIVLAVALLSLSASDYVEMVVNCSSGVTVGSGTASTQSQLQLVRVG